MNRPVNFYLDSIFFISKDFNVGAEYLDNCELWEFDYYVNKYKDYIEKVEKEIANAKRV